LFVTAVLTGACTEPPQYFAITVVDCETGRGVPLVELRTVNGIRHVTDSNGVVAFHEPGLMDRDVFFHVTSHGYEFPKDGFGFRGKSLRVVPGGSAKLSIQRINIAERLYRITGGGAYRDSLLVGMKAPVKEPVLNALVLGSDSVVNVVHCNKIYWFWGDTNRPSFPLGNFHVPGATSLLPGQGGLDPDKGIELQYFTDAKGFAREMARLTDKGPTWLTTAATLPDKTGRERLVGSYVKVQPPLKVMARGLAIFDDSAEKFEHLCEIDMKAPVFPQGPSFVHAEDGVKHVYFAHPFPVVRVRATLDDFQRADAFESFTCLKDGTRREEMELDRDQLDRDERGRLRYAWRKNTPALRQDDEAKLIAAGTIKADEARWQLRERGTDNPVRAHAGSVYWNAYRGRWVMIAVEQGGTSLLGEIWFAEADAPLGPWEDAVKVVTHDRYSFYNPKQHPMFDKDGGRFIYFEGTYTHTFSGNRDATPRYDYNQVMYKLDLASPRLGLPAKER